MPFQTRNVRAGKLTGIQVVELRKLYAEGRTQGWLAQHYGISVGQIGRIVRGEAWQETGGGVRESTQVTDRINANQLMEQLANPLPLMMDESEAAASATRVMELVKQQEAEMLNTTGDNANDLTRVLNDKLAELKDK